MCNSIKKLLFLILAVLVFCLESLIWIKESGTFTPVVNRPGECLIVSHRGYSSNAPENTIASFKQSVSHGVDAIEFDVRSTKDGFIVVMHDDTVTRTTNGTGKVAEKTFADIRSLDAGSWKGPRFAGQTVPELDEVLDFLDKSGQIAVIDIKEPSILEKVIKLASEKAMKDRIFIQSSDKQLLRQVALLNRDIDRVWLCNDFPVKAITPSKQSKWLTETAADIDVGIVNVNYSLLSPRVIKHLHKHNIKVWAWTVNHPQIIGYLLSWGVDGITTDNPEQVKMVRDAEPITSE